MTRRVKRSKDFEISLQISSDDFVRPPRDTQRNWLLNRAMTEFSDELIHLDKVARGFVRGADYDRAGDRTQSTLDDRDIMEDWQIPIMRRMAEIVGKTQGDVLEIGFGRGISATFVQQCEVKSHTIIECNEAIRERFEQWRQQYAERDIRYLTGRWQDVIGDLGKYDAILLHTYPLNEQEYFEQVVQSVTFGEHFFGAARDHLRDGGVFTYFTGEPHSLSRAHQRLLFEFFSSFKLLVEDQLQIPEDTRDAIWTDSLVIIEVVK
jgi:guanidinoacetate N-methyltransferase